MKHAVVMVLWGGPVIEHCMVWQVRNISWNDRLPTSSATKLSTQTKKSAGFPKQQCPPTRLYGITSQTTAILVFIANHRGSHVRCKPLRFPCSSQTTAVLMFVANHCGSHVHHKPLRFSCSLQTTAVPMFVANHCGSQVHHHENLKSHVRLHTSSIRR